jgi:hypothetical protein
MEPTDESHFERRDAAVDHVELDDGTFLLFDPSNHEAWMECESPVALYGWH